jgi:hypothetical protein
VFTAVYVALAAAVYDDYMRGVRAEQYQLIVQSPNARQTAPAAGKN